MKGFAHEVGQWAVDVEDGIAVAEGEVRRPSRIPDPVLDGLVEFHQEVDAVAGVVGAPEETGLEQGGDGEYGKRDHQEKPDDPAPG